MNPWVDQLLFKQRASWPVPKAKNINAFAAKLLTRNVAGTLTSPEYTLALYILQRLVRRIKLGCIRPHALQELLPREAYKKLPHTLIFQ